MANTGLGVVLEFCVKPPEEGDLVFFRFRVHRTEDASCRLMEPEFYEEDTSTPTPQGPHHEVELLSPELWGRPPGSGIHVHTVPETGRHFVCWTGRMSTVVAVLNILRIWCIGTVYTMVTGDGFGGLYGKHKSDFINHMETLGYCIVTPTS